MHALPNFPGIGLRIAHLSETVATRPVCGWLEIHPENFLANPHAQEMLLELSADYPISLHTVGISIGSAGGIDETHLRRIRDLTETIDPLFVSGHLAWSVYRNQYLNDLLPLPYNDEALDVVVRHISQVQDVLARPYLIENPASYVGFQSSTIAETQFLAEMASRTGCRLLCDVSNIVVSAHNMGFDARAYIDGFPADKVAEIHLGGYTPEEELLIDTHAAPIATRAWDLYEYALQRFGPKPTLIEWDNDLPSLATLLGEAAHAATIQTELCPQPEPSPGATRRPLPEGEGTPSLRLAREAPHSLSLRERSARSAG
jgi:uncharacterized protein (UPF0276 family)